MTISREELEALFDLAARAPKSQAEMLWMQFLARRVVEGEAGPPVEEAGPVVEGEEEIVNCEL